MSLYVETKELFGFVKIFYPKGVITIIDVDGVFIKKGLIRTSERVISL